MSELKSLQNRFLDQLILEEVPVSIFLVSGIKLHGMIDGYDEQVLMLKSSLTQMVFKHAVSTVVPSRAVMLPSG